MKIVWDERKQVGNLEKHGMDFAGLHRFDWTAAVIVAGHEARFGKPRYKAVGYLDETLVTVVFSNLGLEALSIISLRPSSASERKTWEWLKSRH